MPTRARQRKQADGVGEARAESQHAVDHLYRSLCSQNERRNPNLPGLQKSTSTHKAALAGVMRERFVVIFNLNKPHCSFSPSFQCISFMHATPGLLSWRMELLVFTSRQFAPKIVEISVRFIRSLVIFFLVSERSARRKPPAERSAS